MYIIDGEVVSLEEAQKRAQVMMLDFETYLAAVGAVIAKENDQLGTGPDGVLEGVNPASIDMGTNSESKPMSNKQSVNWGQTLSAEKPDDDELFQASAIEVMELEMAELQRRYKDPDEIKKVGFRGRPIWNDILRLDKKIQNYYDAQPPDIKNPKTLINKGETQIKEYLEKEFDWLTVEEFGIGNAVKFELDGEMVELDLLPTPGGKRESLQAIKDLVEFDKGLTAIDKLGRTATKSLDAVRRDRNPKIFNEMMEGTGYQLVQNQVGSKAPSTYGNYSPIKFNYDLLKDGEVIMDASSLKDIDKYLEDNINEEDFEVLRQNTYNETSRFLRKRREQLEEEAKVIKADPKVTTKYYEEQYAKDIISFLGLDEDSAEAQNIKMYFDIKKRSFEGQKRAAARTSRNTKRYRDGSANKEYTNNLRNLKDLDPALKQLILNKVGSEANFAKLIENGIANYRHEELQARSTTLGERLMEEEGDQELLRLSQSFQRADKKAFDEKMTEKIQLAGDIYENKFNAVLAEQGKAIMEAAPEGTKLEIKYVNGQPIYVLTNDRNLTGDEAKQFKIAEQLMLKLQEDFTNLSIDFNGTINNITQDINEFYAGSAINEDVYSLAIKEYGLANLFAKDVNDAFANVLLTVPTLLQADWAINQQRILNEKNKYYETMTTYDGGDFATYFFRTLGQQSANITLAIGTGFTGNALKFTALQTQAAIGTTFGLTSGTQTFRDLSVQQDIVKLAKEQERIATEAYEDGRLDLASYNSIMLDINQAIAMNDLSKGQIIGASLANGLIEGSITSVLGTAPNTIKLLKDFQGGGVTNVAKNLFASNSEKFMNFAGKPLITRVGSELAEEELIYLGQQYVSEFAILDREFNLDQFDDTFFATLVTAGSTNAVGVGYSTVLNVGLTNKIEKKLNKLRINNQDLSKLIAQEKNEANKKKLLYSMTENLGEQALDIDRLAIDILNLGAKDIKRLIGTEMLLQQVKERAGVMPGMTSAAEAEMMTAYKDKLTKEEAKNFDAEIQALNTIITDIKGKVDKAGGYRTAIEALGPLYTRYNSKLKESNEDGYNDKTKQDQLVQIIQTVRDDITLENIEKAKSNPNIVEQVENMVDEQTGEAFNEEQKNSMYAFIGRDMALLSSRALANKLNVDASIESILEDSKNLKVIEIKTAEELEKAMDADKVAASERPSFDNMPYGFVVGNKIYTQNAEQVQQDIDNGELKAGTVILHEIAHIVDDARMNEKGKLTYAINLFDAASNSDNAGVRAAHENVLNQLRSVYGDDLDFENDATIRDEYTKYLQEHLFAFEDELQLEKDEAALVRAFNDLTTDANNLNTPEKALNYLISFNSAFRSGKLSRKSRKAIDSAKPTELKKSERTLNEDAKKYKADDPSLDMGRFLDQYKKLGLRALGYSPGKGDIATDEAISFIMSEFPSITRNFDPEAEAEFSTYATNVLRARGQGFYKQQLAPKQGKQRITAASEATRLVSDETAESGIELEERRKREEEKKPRLIDPLKSKNVNDKIDEIEKAVAITKSNAPIADFKTISQDFGSKVAGIIFNIPESKIKDGAKNLTYAKKIIDGVPQQSEAGNIQSIYSDPQVLARDIRLLPDTNVTSEESRVGDLKVPVSRDVQGRSLGLPNKIIKYFYEDTGKRSKGTTSQTKVYKKKAKFNNPTNEVIQQVQRDMGITPAGELNLYDRNIGQLLKGFAKVKGSVTAVAVAKKKIGEMDLRTAKGKTQIEADVGAGRSKIQFSAKPKTKYIIKAQNQTRATEKVSKTKARPDGKKGRAYDRDAVLPESVSSFKGETVIQGFDRVLNNFLTRFPQYNTYLKNSLVYGETRSPYGVVSRFNDNLINKGRQADIKRTPMTKDRFLTPAYIASIKTEVYVEDQKKKLDVLYEFYKDAETYLKDNKKDAWVFDEIATSASNSQNAPVRALAPALIVEVDDNGNPIKKRGIEEHTEPQNDIGTLLTQAAIDGRVDEVFPVVRASYMQGFIDLNNNDLLDIDYKKSMPELFGKGVDLFLAGKLKLDDGLLSTIRLTESGINLNNILYIPTNQTLGEYFFGTNDLDIDNQKSLMRDLFNGEKTLNEIKAEAQKIVAADNKLQETFVKDANKEIEFGNTADKAMADARDSVKYSQKIKKARVFDFDDTLARTKSKVIVNMPDGKSRRISATEFATEAQALLDEGAEFDFEEFNRVIDGKKGPLFEVAKKIQDARGSEDIFILTARPQAAAINIKEFLDGLGLNIPLKNITGLADGRPKAKADWFVEKYAEGYNDFYFADDALKNVKAVKDIFDVLDVKSRVQQARVKFSKKLDKDFNDMIERNKGVKSEAKFSDVKARRMGKNQKKFAFFIPPSADDFRGLTMYTFAGKGKQGELDQEFFDKALIKPYQRGIAAMEIARTAARTDYRALLSENKPIRKRLKKKVAGTKFTLDEAIRVYLWDKAGYEIPGLSKADQKKLVDYVNKDPDLIAFADGVQLITRKDKMYEPTEFWDGSTILGDLNNIIRVVNRDEYLKEFNENVDIIFSKENLNKVEAIYGFRVREALENSIYRMKTGSNANKGSGRIVNNWNNWVNNSVGAIMFFNRRSALLQTISTVNFVNWSDNNPIKAAQAFADQVQYWKDFITLWNSPKLIARRRGLESDLQEAEIAAAARKGGVQGVISYLLKIGFTPTQLADSFAIASGGATFYRNRINTYKKQGLSQAEAEVKAFEDFSSIADETQQSADPMLISQQQASVLGRLVLAFQNTPMQYTRLIKKAAQDLINGRGSKTENISKIIYYGFVQNLIFSTLQNAMFALLPGFDDEEEDFATDEEREKYFEKQQYREEQKITRTLNSMMDTLLRGSGLAGAVVSTVKNVILEYQKYESKNQFAKENADILLAVTSISPPINYKLRQINNALQTKEFEKDVIAERGFDVTIDGKFMLSPTYDIIADVSSAVFNLPLNRAIDEVNAITEALDARNTLYQRIALAAGWRVWDVGAKFEEHELIKTHAKAKRKEEGIEKAKETRKRNKELEKKHKAYRSKVLNALPDSIRIEIQKAEAKVKEITPKFRLDQLVKEHNLDVKYE